ncbi:hypothetical protein GCM10010527_53040 [Streptomyces drozdowiczii]
MVVALIPEVSLVGNPEDREGEQRVVGQVDGPGEVRVDPRLGGRPGIGVVAQVRPDRPDVRDGADQLPRALRRLDEPGPQRVDVDDRAVQCQLEQPTVEQTLDLQTLRRSVDRGVAVDLVRQPDVVLGRRERQSVGHV